VDVAAIDCISLAILCRHRSTIAQATRVLGQTMAAPVGPYVTRSDLSEDTIARIRRGLLEATADPELAAVRADLCIRSFHELSVDAYNCIGNMERKARDLGNRDFEQLSGQMSLDAGRRRMVQVDANDGGATHFRESRARLGK
jgi:ABC-type phosphate/phosphonate transport system substrate-binding protein